MAIQIYSNEDDESDRVLPDGDVLRVPLHMMDGLQRAVALGTRGDGGEPLVVDGLGQRSHAPGFVYLKALTAGDRAANADAERAWRERGEWLRDAWRNPTQSVNDNGQTQSSASPHYADPAAARAAADALPGHDLTHQS
jgi:hypothetical protein